MNNMVILRSLPGAGKSFLAKKIYDAAIKNNKSAIICSTDSFFMVDGEYKFDPKKLGHNHRQNFLKAQQAIIDVINCVIIDNTNTTKKEIQPYVEIALEADYFVSFVEPQTAWAKNVDVCFVKGTHNVPKASLQSMIDRWQETDDIGEALAEELDCYYDLTHEMLHNHEERNENSK